MGSSASNIYDIEKLYGSVDNYHQEINQSFKSKNMNKMWTGVEIIQEERTRQIEEKKHTRENDRIEYQDSELARAAVAYAMPPESRPGADSMPPYVWPWAKQYWKPTHAQGREGRIKELAKAGALIAAEIDRLNSL